MLALFELLLGKPLFGDVVVHGDAASRHRAILDRTRGDAKGPWYALLVVQYEAQAVDRIPTQGLGQRATVGCERRRAIDLARSVAFDPIRSDQLTRLLAHVFRRDRVHVQHGVLLVDDHHAVADARQDALEPSRLPAQRLFGELPGRDIA